MFSRILVPLDQSTLAEQALGPAAAIARHSRGEVGLILAHEMSPYDGFLDASWRDARDPEESIYIRKLAEEVARGAGVTVSGTVGTGKPVDVICRRAHEIGADLIVMTTHGRTGFSRLWMGSVADGVMRRSSVPVLMIRPREMSAQPPYEAPLFHRVLVPLDGSTTSSAVLPAAVDLVRASGGVLTLVQVVLPVPLYVFDAGIPAYASMMADPERTKLVQDSVRDELAALARSLEQEYGVRVETEVVVGDGVVASVLDLAKARDVDLIALTTHGRGMSRLIVGSVADKIIRGSALPLLLFRPNAVGVHEQELAAHAAATA